MSETQQSVKASFWDHLEELRGSIIRIVVALVLFGVIAFMFKDFLFDIVLAPQSYDFITYRIFDQVSQSLPFQSEGVEQFQVKLINTQLAQQFLIHVRVAIYAAFLLIFPYVLYELFRFVSPALYMNERKYALRIISSGYIMFMLGVALSYFLIFPLTFRFLGTYQVSTIVENQIVLESYISTLMMLNLMMGVVFEIPILCWLFAKMGFISAPFLKKYRKHAIVILLVIAAIITPTADIVTLLLVSMPMYLLYELSILIIATTIKPKELQN